MLVYALHLKKKKTIHKTWEIVVAKCTPVISFLYFDTFGTFDTKSKKQQEQRDPKFENGVWVNLQKKMDPTLFHQRLPTLSWQHRTPVIQLLS